MPERPTQTARVVQAGCFTCHGGEARWTGAQAQGTAARHYDVTGHPTWCDVAMSVWYGSRAADVDQLEIEHAIASAA